MYVFLTLLVATASLLYGIRYIFKRNCAKNWNRNSASVMIIAGSGGHTTEILSLVSCLGNHYTPFYYVMAETDRFSENAIHTFHAHKKNKNYEIHRIPRSREVGQSWISSIYTTLYASFCSFPLVFKVKPDIILCNGPGTCIPLCVAGLFLKYLIKNVIIIYVESICRVETLSLSARLLYYIIDHILVQWPQLQTKNPGIKFFGRLV